MKEVRGGGGEDRGEGGEDREAASSLEGNLASGGGGRGRKVVGGVAISEWGRREGEGGERAREGESERGGGGREKERWRMSGEVGVMSEGVGRGGEID